MVQRLPNEGYPTNHRRKVQEQCAVFLQSAAPRTDGLGLTGLVPRFPFGHETHTTEIFCFEELLGMCVRAFR